MTTSEMCFPWLVRQLPVIAEHIALSRARLAVRKPIEEGSDAICDGDMIGFRPEDWPGLDAPGLRLTQTQIDDYFKPTPVNQTLGTAPGMNAA